MKELSYTITDPEGIHARPAGALVKEASKFECNVTLTKDGKEANAKRIFGIMGLAAKKGETLLIRCDGPDEEEAMKHITAFLQENM